MTLLGLCLLLACTTEDPGKGTGSTDAGTTTTDGGTAGTDGGTAGTDGGTTDGGATTTDGGTATDGGTDDDRLVACQAASAAARAYVDSLTTDQVAEGVKALDSEARTEWSNLPPRNAPRDGLYFADLDSGQLDLVRGMIETSLSARGAEQASNVIAVEQWWQDGGDDMLDASLYSVVVFGSPASDAPWAWQLDGHHMALSFTASCPDFVITPAFWGIQPLEIPTGDLAGLRVLGDEVDRGFDLLASLDAEQLDRAVIRDLALPDLVAGAGRDDGIPTVLEGLPGSELEAEQRELLLELLATWVEDAPEPHAALRMVEVEAELDDTWFAWAGPTDGSGLFYYRIHGPSVFIELDQLNVDHIHSIYRSPVDDYGASTLADHYAAFEHGI